MHVVNIMNMFMCTHLRVIVVLYTLFIRCSRINTQFKVTLPSASLACNASQSCLSVTSPRVANLWRPQARISPAVTDGCHGCSGAAEDLCTPWPWNHWMSGEQEWIVLAGI